MKLPTGNPKDSQKLEKLKVETAKLTKKRQERIDKAIAAFEDFLEKEGLKLTCRITREGSCDIDRHFKLVTTDAFVDIQPHLIPIEKVS